MKPEMKHIEDYFKKILQEKMSMSPTSIKNCQVILHFCYIASRAGTDISATVDELDRLQVDKPVILVVLHHTFDPEKVIPDSNATVKRKKIFAVDCLFYENEVLHCQKNTDEVDKIKKYLNLKNLTSYACVKENDECHIENEPLICSGEHASECSCMYMCQILRRCWNWLCRKCQSLQRWLRRQNCC